ncbi:SURF1 family protein [Marinobacter sp.]|uniref:SURF1 family protein n=1 Tax=Marinobacter sp. TaxID=50741 RepID=UPI002B269830|nr:SURF1 family protein [Marinobacter sp.]
MDRRWHFDWRLLLFSGLFLPLLLNLGFWQLDRAEEKETLLQAWQQRANDIPWAERVAGDLQPGLPVFLTGFYDKHIWLLDNRTRDGVPGYEVLTLFRPLEGPAVVVNRGWVRGARTRDTLPAIETPGELLTLEGRLAEYPDPPVLANEDSIAVDWPRRVQALPKTEVAEFVNEPAPVTVMLSDPQQPGAYRADRVPDVMAPQTHYGYAVQWFALAAVLTILTVVASYRRSET